MGGAGPLSRAPEARRLQRGGPKLALFRRLSQSYPNPPLPLAPGEIGGRLTLAANEVKCGHGAPKRILNMRVRVPQLRIVKAERRGGR